ncbi:MAG: hypothetical protein ACTSQV_06730, partial [Alphaproteobacteria bacterium]
MQDRSAGDRSQPADRLSLCVSALLIGGLLLASVALYQNARIDKPKPPKRPAAPAARQMPSEPAVRQSGSAAMAIQLPPPPKRNLSKPARRAVEKPHKVEPLKRTVAARPARDPATSAPPRIEPAAKSRIKPLEPAKPAPKPVARPRPVPAPAIEPSKAFAKAMVDGARNRKAGGALLRLLEHGQGPTIEIAWPRRADARRALYRQLTQCYGVKAAVLVGGSKLYASAGTPGQPWPIDMDRFSGFIRSPRGEAIAEEARVFARIADRHGVADWRPVRVFPRHVDAALLGGLGALLGPLYKSAKQIRAAYRWDRARLI